MTAHNFNERGFNTILLKPEIDNRSGGDYIESRIGLKKKTIAISKDESVIDKISCLESFKNDLIKNFIIVDEVQFFTEQQIDELAYIVDFFEIDVFCYGLKTDFTGKLFEASKRLFEIADKFEEIKSICECGNKTTFNARINELGEVITEGEQVLIGGNESYKPLCRKCFKNNLK